MVMLSTIGKLKLSVPGDIDSGVGVISVAKLSMLRRPNRPSLTMPFMVTLCRLCNVVTSDAVSIGNEASIVIMARLTTCLDNLRLAVIDIVVLSNKRLVHINTVSLVMTTSRSSIYGVWGAAGGSERGCVERRDRCSNNFRHNISVVSRTTLLAWSSLLP